MIIKKNIFVLCLICAFISITHNSIGASLCGKQYSISSVEIITENSSSNSSSDRSKDNVKILLGITILLFLIAVIFLLKIKANKKTIKKLQLKNKHLQNLNTTKDKFFSIISHDLKSPFNSLLGFSEILSLHAEGKNYKEIIEYSKTIHKSTRKLYVLVDTLLQWSRTQLGATDYNPGIMDVAIASNNII